MRRHMISWKKGGIPMAVIDSAYQYYLSTYAGSGMSRYDTHKKSQLRAVYNNIVKVNKDSPLYKINFTRDTGRFAIDIKEQARSIENFIAALSNNAPDDNAEHAFSRKIAQSSDEDAVSVQYIGSNMDADNSKQFDITVERLATPQVNRGVYLAPGASDFVPGNYSFDLNTNLSSYEFQYTISGRDTNETVQRKIMRLINNANIGLNATLVSNDRGQNALSITSQQTGLGDSEQYLFEIMPAPDSGSIRAMRTLGINDVTEMPVNSLFLLNGTEHSSLSNTFTVNNAFELTLKAPSADGESATIGFKADTDAVADNVQSLVNVYNNMIQLGHNYHGSQESGKLLHDMESVAKSYFNELESIGLNLQQDGSIQIDKNLLTDAVSAPDARESFRTMNNFKNGLQRKATQASIDPISYVSKVLIAYKNPGHNFAAAYHSSVYSGLMLDTYC